MRALRFMDTLLQRDNLQKAAFLKDLTSFWTRFDSRILCYKVRPAAACGLGCLHDAGSQSRSANSTARIHLERSDVSVIPKPQVLPALLEELRNEAVQALALPLVLRIIAQQPPKDFMDVTLPAMLPVAASVKVCLRP